MRTHISDVINKEGQEVELYGWVRARRDHGKIVFIDLNDKSGSVQVVLPAEVVQAHSFTTGTAVVLVGVVGKRPAGMENSNDSELGKFEIKGEKIISSNRAEGLPLPTDTDGYEIDEEVRMRYRYLDLRRPRLAKNIAMRHKVIKAIRDFLDKEGFCEIETPILTKSTPEGARDYLVPSRLETGKFYALPQSPQQYKQLLMVAGMEKYFQIARCFRDEDTRGDRQPEFTQLDMEMSFVDREDVMALNEKLLIELVGKLYPDKKIQEIPFPRLTYKEAMEKYGSDKPDLRKDKNDSNLLAFCWVIDFPFFEKIDTAHSEVSVQEWTFTHNPFSAPKPEFMNDLLSGKNIAEILTTQYDVALNGFEIGGGSIRNHKPEALKAVFKIMGFEDERIKKNFGHMLQALGFGAPPHGGIAWGLDRLMAILQNEPNIREVIAFPKTGDGRDLMMESPSVVEKAQLDELGLEIRKTKK